MFITRLSLDSLNRLPAYTQALPTIKALNDDALPLTSPITIFTGDNGSGKSTLIEAIAVAMGANPEGGSRNTRFDLAKENHALGQELVVTRTANPKDVFFLRGESFLHLGDYYSSILDRTLGDLPELSHGQSLMKVFQKRIDNGLVLLDEPEDGLSMFRQLELLGMLWHVAQRGGQVIMATHSPVLLAIPDAQIFNIEDLQPVAFDDTDTVRSWREFIADPRGTVNYLLAG